MLFKIIFQDTQPRGDVIVVCRLKMVELVNKLNWIEDFTLLLLLFELSVWLLLLFVADVFICGGYNGEVILDDLWKINLQTFQWNKLPAVMPEPAYFHCAAVTPVSLFYLNVFKIFFYYLFYLHFFTIYFYVFTFYFCHPQAFIFILLTTFFFFFLFSFSGRLHVHPRWRGEHPWE